MYCNDVFFWNTRPSGNGTKWERGDLDIGLFENLVTNDFVHTTLFSHQL